MTCAAPDIPGKTRIRVRGIEDGEIGATDVLPLLREEDEEDTRKEEAGGKNEGGAASGARA